MQLTVLDGQLDVDRSYLAADVPTIREQVREYETGERTAFDLDVAFPDSFRGRVMDAMTAIPYGATRTYGDIAAELDTAPIAVGQACASNPVPLVVPCHRVVASDGSLRGYSGEGGIEFKRLLLEHEGALDQPTPP